jgi:hypothetical protein
MAISYFDALQQGYPTVIARCLGDPFDYNSLDWEGGDAIPSQDELNEWILANPGYNPLLTLTKYQFRQLFTLNERVAVDAAPTNTDIPANYRAILFTMVKDLDLSEAVHLDNPQVTAGIGLLVQLGLLTAERAAQILSNTPTPV